MWIKFWRHPAQRFVCSVDAGTGAGAGAGDGGAAAAAAAAAAAGANGAGANGGGDPWYQPHVASGKLDKETLAWLDGKKFPSDIDALKSGALADKMVRDRNVIPRPNKDKLGEWEGWSALGFDPDKNKYAATIKPPKLPNDAPHDAALFDAFVGFAHELKAPPAIAEGLIQKMSDFVNGRLSALASDGIKAREKLDGELHKEWGTDYDVKVEGAIRAAKAFGLTADASSDLEKIIGAPALLKFLDGLGAKLGEGGLVQNDGLGGTGALTPASAEAELRRIEADKDFMRAFTNSRDPGYKDAKAKWQRLTEIAAKGKAQK